MPVELTERGLRDSIAVIGEWDQDGARAAEAALEWIGWEGEGPLLLRRYDVQLFVWYTLPRKFLASLEHKREAAEALARTLVHLGGRAGSYAEVCRSPDTDELLCAWEAEDPEAWSRFRALLEGSGIEPPDTGLLAWGRAMGLEEARVREQVATALETAIEEGRLLPGAPAFRRRQAGVMNAALRGPWDGGAGRSRLDAVHAERLERWLQRGRTRGGAERRAVIEPVRSITAAGPPAINRDAASEALAPTLWLLEKAGDGIALTQTGALNRALVREVAERWPGWWDAELFGPPNREDDVALLGELHELLRSLRLVRRRGRRIVTTARGHKLLADPPTLLVTLASELIGGEDFGGACAELAVALILDGVVADYSDALAERLQPAIAAEGWQSAGEPPSIRDIGWAVACFLRPAESIGIFERREGRSSFSRDPLVLTEAGRVALIAGLRSRALAPAKGPYA